MQKTATSSGAKRARKKFLRYFPQGFRDPTYLEWERDYKWETHQRWEAALNQGEFRRLLRAGEYPEIAARAVRVEQQSRHSMIFSFEKMALRDAVKPAAGARVFAEGLYEFLHGRGEMRSRFERWCAAVAALPRRQTRVLTLATGDRVGVHRAASRAYLSQAVGDPARRGGVWLRAGLRITT